MNKLEVYIKPTCPYCIRVLDFYDSKGLEPIVYDVTAYPELRSEMEERVPNARTVPQSLVDDRPIGGCDEVMKLEQKGEFDALFT